MFWGSGVVVLQSEQHAAPDRAGAPELGSCLSVNGGASTIADIATLASAVVSSQVRCFSLLVISATCA